MKKILILIIVCMIFFSCDHSVYMDLNIKNNCEHPIVVNAIISYYKPQNILDTISPFSEKNIYQCRGILGFSIEYVSLVLKDMKITQNGRKINYNPVDTTRWQFSQTGKYNYEAILTVNPKDFE